MAFTDHFIKRPVLAISLNLILVAIGMICFTKLNLRQYPDITPSVISVVTSYPGASALDIETFITTPLEESLANTDHIDTITSSSSRGASTVTMTFNLNSNINAALSDIYSKVAIARGTLPPDIIQPIIQKVDPNMQPLIYLGLLSKHRTHMEVADYFERSIKPLMQNLPGLGQIKMFGNYDYAMRVNINPFALQAHNLTASEFNMKLQANNVYTPTGLLKGINTNYPLNLTNQPNTAKGFQSIAINTNQNEIIYASQVANITLGTPNQETVVSVNGEPAVFLGLIPGSGANPITLSNAINKMVKNIKDSLPTDYIVRIFWDSAVFIKDSLKEVGITILETTLAVIMIMLLSLGSIKMIRVPAITIPLSLISTFSVMLALGFTINTFTLLAMVLSIGLVVDDAIVVLENIHRHIENGMPPKEAAFVGAREIQFPIIAMTLTLAAVFAPIGFLGGVTGILFKEFAFTLAASVILSGIIALTLSPMMCANIFKGTSHASGFELKVFNTFQKIGQRYQTILTKTIHWKKSIIAMMIVMSCACIAGFLFTSSELVPKEDSGAVLSFLSGPPSASLDYMLPYTKQFSHITKNVPERQENAMITGLGSSNSAMSILILKPWANRTRSADDITQSLQQKVSRITGINAFVINPFSVPGTSSSMPVGFVVKTLGSLTDLNTNMQKLVNSIRDKKSPYFQWEIFYPNTSFKIDTPMVNFKINRQHLADLGISMQSLGQSLSLALTERAQGYFIMNHKRFDVLSQLQTIFKTDPSQLSKIAVRTNSGKMVPLSYLVDISYSAGPASINHFQQLRSATFAAAALMPGYSMGNALAHIKKAAKAIFPPGTMFDYSGESRTYVETQGQTPMLFVYAIIFIFLVLAAQYESFRDPFIILTCVPLSTFGALALLNLTGGSINMYTNIGMVTLIGLVSKHGILIVDYANHLIIDKNQTKLNAIIEAARIRLRPILITTAAMLLAALPLALATGPGHIARNQMGWTILGGMTIGTMMSLFVVPTLYLLISRHKN